MAKKEENFIYSTKTIMVNKNQRALFNYLNEFSCLAKILKNKAVFNNRQTITSSQRNFTTNLETRINNEF